MYMYKLMNQVIKCKFISLWNNKKFVWEIKKPNQTKPNQTKTKQKTKQNKNENQPPQNKQTKQKTKQNKTQGAFFSINK